jgi:hypothetical protein
LRPHIKAIDFAARVLQQQREGNQLAPFSAQAELVIAVSSPLESI